MLGLRRYAGAQIDLFQGVFEETPGLSELKKLFVCDMMVPVGSDHAGASYGDAMMRTEEAGLRHLVFAAEGLTEAPNVAREIMVAIRRHLDQRQGGSLGRITCLLTDQESYAAFQQALFEAFPE